MNKLYVAIFCVLLSLFALPASAQETFTEETGDMEQETVADETIIEEVIDATVVDETIIEEVVEPEADATTTEESISMDDEQSSELEETAVNESNTTNSEPESELESQIPNSEFQIPKIYLSEINWAGSNLSTADEWIELYNADSAGVDLGGWILTGSATSGESLMLASDTWLDAGLTLLISNYKFGDEKTTLAVEPDLVSSALSIPNTKLEIILAMADGTVVDELIDAGTPDFGSSDPKASMTRDMTTLEWMTSTTSANLADKTQMGTPGTVATIAQELEVESSNSENLIINEFVSDPSDETEWIAIFNSGSKAIDLTGCTLQDATEKSTELGETTLEAGTTLIVENPKGKLNNDGDTISLLDPDGNIIASVTYGTEAVPAPDKGESLIYQNGEWIINQLEATEPNTEETTEEPATEINDEMSEIIEEELGEPEAEAELVEETEIIEESENSDSQPSTSYSIGALIITEFVSDPEDGVEWIEIYNPGTTAINLTDWSVSDATDKKTSFDITEIKPGAWVVIENPKGKLNNDEDEIKLYDPNGNLIDEVLYSGVLAPGKGESLAKDESNGWTTTNQITKGEKNLYEESTTTAESDSSATTESGTDSKTEQTTVSNSEQKRSADDSTVSTETETHRVIAIAEKAETVTTKMTSSSSTSKASSASSTSERTITGVVTAVPGTFGSQIAYVDGTQLYFYYADWPELSIGDQVSVTGVQSSNRGEERLKISNQADIQITSHSNLIPESISLSQALNSDTGSLVTVIGSIVERDGAVMIIEDATGEMTVVAHGNTDIAWSSITTSQVQITGVMRNMNGEMKLYPRFINDVTEIQSEVENQNDLPVISGTSKGNSTPWVGLGLLGACLGALSYWFFRNRKLKLLTLTPNT